MKMRMWIIVGIIVLLLIIIIPSGKFEDHIRVRGQLLTKILQWLHRNIIKLESDDEETHGMVCGARRAHDYADPKDYTLNSDGHALLLQPFKRSMDRAPSMLL